jgi:hypothetical protein
LKLVQERAGNTLEAICISKDFLSRTPAAQQLRERMDKWDFIKSKTSVGEDVGKKEPLYTADGNAS